MRRGYFKIRKKQRTEKNYGVGLETNSTTKSRNVEGTMQATMDVQTITIINNPNS